MPSLTGATTVTFEELIGADLLSPLRRTDLDVLSLAAPRINDGTPGLRRGTLTLLCATWASASAVEELYRTTATITLTTGAGQALDGLKHRAVGQLRVTAERTVPGRPSKWAVQAEFREVP